MSTKPQKAPRAPFITLEGGEGCGKSTQASMLGRRIRGLGLKVVLTREPGGASLGQTIRELLLGPGQEPVDPVTELLLFLADRSHHVRAKIEPALSRGEVVVCDRFADSSEVYQGLARGLGLERVRRLNQWVCGQCWPDLTLLLDLNPGLGLARAAQRQGELGQGPSHMEQESLDFHERLREGFLAQAQAEPGRIKLIDAARPAEEVAETIWAHVEPLLRDWRCCGL